MKRLQSLVLLFLMAGCSIYAQNTFGKFELFIPADDTFDLSEHVGTMIGRAGGTLNLKTGGTDSAVLEMYSYNKDRISDLYLIRRSSGRVVSLGLDTTSSQYRIILEELKDFILPDTLSNKSPIDTIAL